MPHCVRSVGRLKERIKMIAIGDTIVSFDVINEQFLCDIASCKGACCIEGDCGAPLTLDEVGILEEILPVVWNDLSEAAKKVIDKQGVAYADIEGEMVTSIVGNKDCVFTYQEDGVCKCAIEKAHNEGKTTFKKPISCHLYPIRIQKYKQFTAVNYHKWDICSAACVLGKRQKLRMYQFLKEPLIRRFGSDWYNELVVVASELDKQGVKLRRK